MVSHLPSTRTRAQIKQPPSQTTNNGVFNHRSFPKPAVSLEILTVSCKEGSLERMGNVSLE